MLARKLNETFAIYYFFVLRFIAKENHIPLLAERRGFILNTYCLSLPNEKHTLFQ